MGHEAGQNRELATQLVAVDELPGADGARRPLMVSPLTGNEQYCLHQRGLEPGTFVLGNHIFSLGLLGNIKSFFTSLGGGANATDSNFMQENRNESFGRLVAEARAAGMDGVVNTACQIVHHQGGVLEFLVTGGGVTWRDRSLANGELFTVACTGEQLSCLLDLGFIPLKLVFGTESYSRGLGGAITGGLRRMFISGEIPEYSETFMAARITALRRMREEAYACGANLVSGVKLTSMNYMMLQEISVLGTACKHPALPVPQCPDDVITSALSEQELWSLCSQGFMPRSIVMAVSIYNMGLGNDITNFFQNIGGGELTKFTELVTEARRRVQTKISQEARLRRCDRVLGMQTEIENFAGSGCVEFFAYGTGVIRNDSVRPMSTQLSAQHFSMERASFTSQVKLHSDRTTSADIDHQH
eukprot:TRINITY_DN23048_c0_g1_i2.p1 TRINITY_DN23048_c0_g1~~TRINITY_DN23048_c0_g1_i2.p1  ORF type:complete len:416 (+),score=47.81 TRINITY_DN23048_c0_g1_i2:82-1329(+)